MRIFVVDDHPVVREGLCFLIRSQEDMTVAGTAASAAEAISGFDASVADAMVLDLGLADMNGLEVLAAVRRRDPGARVLVLTIDKSPVTIRRAIEWGALGYLLKEAVGTDLIHAIRSVCRGEVYLSAGAATGLAHSVAQRNMSDREFKVLEELGQGLSNKSIAARLNISEETVKTHVRRVLEKLGAKDRLEAVVRAAREGLIRLE